MTFQSFFLHRTFLPAPAVFAHLVLGSVPLASLGGGGGSEGRSRHWASQSVRGHKVYKGGGGAREAALESSRSFRAWVLARLLYTAPLSDDFDGSRFRLRIRRRKVGNRFFYARVRIANGPCWKPNTSHKPPLASCLKTWYTSTKSHLAVREDSSKYVSSQASSPRDSSKNKARNTCPSSPSAAQSLWEGSRPKTQCSITASVIMALGIACRDEELPRNSSIRYRSDPAPRLNERRTPIVCAAAAGPVVTASEVRAAIVEEDDSVDLVPCGVRRERVVGKSEGGSLA